MTGIRVALFATFMTFSAPVLAGDLAVPAGIPMGNAEACQQGPTSQFGRYIGDWKIEDSQFARDGSGWSPGQGARWIFACLGNGMAVQDYWMPANGNVGTNLRIYNAETESWDIAWATNATPGIAQISAKQDEQGNIVMHYVSPLPGPLRRITFAAPDDGGWNWKLEFSQDAGDTWFEVYRIRATPFSPEPSD